MPRGRLPVGMVLITFNVSLSMTVTVLSRWLDTKILSAKAEGAVQSIKEAIVARAVQLTICSSIRFDCLASDFACRLGGIDTERIGQIPWMKEAFLRRHRYERTRA